MVLPFATDVNENANRDCGHHIDAHYGARVIIPPDVERALALPKGFCSIPTLTRCISQALVALTVRVGLEGASKLELAKMCSF